MLGSWTFLLGNFIDMAGKTGKGVMMPQTFIQDSGSISKNSFLLAYTRVFKTDRIPSPMSAAQGYDGMHLLAMAMRQASSTDGAQIRLALETLKSRYQGAITSYKKPFSANDHDAITQNMLLMGKVHAGRIDYAYTEDQNRPEYSAGHSSCPGVGKIPHSVPLDISVFPQLFLIKISAMCRMQRTSPVEHQRQRA